MAADLTVDRRPIAFVDMETFKGHSYPDVLISVLIKSLYEFKKWLENAATAPATKKSFWNRLFGTSPQRPPFNRAKTTELIDGLKKTIQNLEEQLTAPESAAIVKTEKVGQQSSDSAAAKAEIGAGGSTVGAEKSTSKSAEASSERQLSYVSHKIGYLHQHIIGFQRFFQDLAALSDGPGFLVLDDLYHIKREDQPKVIDYFHRVAKGNGLWLKIGTIKHRSEWYKHSDPPMGMKLGDDAKEINLDISLEKFEILRDFLRKILTNLLAEIPPLTIGGLLNRTAIDRLIIASGGVTRDFIGIFSNSIGQARNRGEEHHRGPKIGAEDVNLATGEYDPIKREEFKLDTDEDRVQLEEAFSAIRAFCTEKAKCNVFLVSQKLDGSIRESLDQLIDLRLIHPVKSRVTLKTGATGEIFEAYMLDLSQYIAARKVHDFRIVDLGGDDKDEFIRKASLVYGKDSH